MVVLKTLNGESGNELNAVAIALNLHKLAQLKVVLETGQQTAKLRGHDNLRAGWWFSF
jgi:hypothetical protein